MVVPRSGPRGKWVNKTRSPSGAQTGPKASPSQVICVSAWVASDSVQMVRRAPSLCAPRLRECTAHVPARGGEGWQQSAQHGDRDRAGECIDHQAPVETHLLNARHACGKRVKEARRTGGQHEAERTTHQRQDEGLGDWLRDDRPAGRAQRHTDRDLVLALHGAGQQQGGDIGARDQE